MSEETSQLTISTLQALHEAALIISNELSLKKVLQRITDVARTLVDAEYAALGVPNSSGGLDAFIHSGIDPALVKKMGALPQGKGVLGAILREKRPFRLKAISAHPQSVGFPPHHPQMSSFLGVPIVAGDTVVGNLYLTNKQNAESFTEKDELLVQMLAAHAAIAIQNARLYEQNERLAVLEERNRIGMDLHDGVIQSIYAVGLTLSSARMGLPDELSDVDGLLETAVSQLNHAIQDIRNFIMDLRPRHFRGNLEEGIAQLVREFQANTIIPVTLKLSGLDERSTPLPYSVGRTLFLTAQEALANVARHARATAVTLTLTVDSERIKLIVADNGVGIAVEAQSSTVGHGLSNMKTRAQELGGSCILETGLGGGTAVSITLPLP